MHWIMVASVVVIATGLEGCTSVMGPTPAPSCDGGARRPLNRSMWDWEAVRPGAPVAGAVTANLSQGSPSVPASSGEALVRKGEAGAPGRIGAPREQRPASFDIAASLRACTGEVSHG